MWGKYGWVIGDKYGPGRDDGAGAGMSSGEEREHKT